MNIPVATATEVATRPTLTDRPTAGAVHTTVDTVGVTDGIMMDGVIAAIVMIGVMVDTTLLVVMADGVMVVDSVMKGMVVADSRIQDMAEGAIAADPTGHRISRTIV
jgi:hypothetical protein